jgi:hypothetical protein
MNVSALTSITNASKIFFSRGPYPRKSIGSGPVDRVEDDAGTMTAHRFAYTRKELAPILGVSQRTLVRWHAEGKHFHPWQDPEDPFKRWMYDLEEVEEFRRAHRRGSGIHRIAPGREVAVKAWTLEPTVPGPVAGRVYARLQAGEPIDEICKAEGVAPEQVIRLEQLRKRFEEERDRPVRRPSEPRMVTDASNPEIAALAKELDEERRRGAAGRDRRNEEDDGLTAGDDSEHGAPRKGAR